MDVKNNIPLDRRWTAAELRKLPPAQRDAIMEAAAALAEEDYRNDPQLTAFEAFGKDDLYGESSSSETLFGAGLRAPEGLTPECLTEGLPRSS